MEIQYVLAAMASAAALFVALSYLHWRTRERYLIPWIGMALVWVLRDGAAVSAAWLHIPFPEGIEPATAVARGILALWGARVLVGRPLPWATWPVVTASLAWIFLAPPPSIQPWSMLVPLGVSCSGFVYAGATFQASGRLPAGERRVTGAALTLMGMVHLLYPLSFVAPWTQPLGFASTAALQLVLAVGILLAYFRASAEEAARVSRRVELALTRVLSDFVSICVHCKHVRDEGDRWLPVEGYVALRTEAAVDATHCPACTRG